jgi:zinc and cadmium transporter
LLIHGGCSLKKALVFNFLTALTSIAGGLVSLAIGATHVAYVDAVLPATAGGFIYIAGTDLIPELHKKIDATSSIGQFFSFAAGIAMMAALVLAG